MPALVAGIHAWTPKQGVDGRDKPGHDGLGSPRHTLDCHAREGGHPVNTEPSANTGSPACAGDDNLNVGEASSSSPPKRKKPSRFREGFSKSL